MAAISRAAKSLTRGVAQHTSVMVAPTSSERNALPALVDQPMRGVVMRWKVCTASVSVCSRGAPRFPTHDVRTPGRMEIRLLRSELERLDCESR